MRDDRRGRAEAARLQALDLEAHLADPAMRQRFVTPMFDVIAPRYDDFTRIFSWSPCALDSSPVENMPLIP